VGFFRRYFSRNYLNLKNKTRKFIKTNIWLGEKFRKIPVLNKFLFSYEINKDWLEGFYIGYAIGMLFYILAQLHWWGFI